MKANWFKGILSGLIAIAAILFRSQLAHHVNVLSNNIHLVGWIAALIVLVTGIICARNLGSAIGEFVTNRKFWSAGAGVRIVITGFGYVIVLISALSLVGISLGRLLVSVGLLGVILGIAAQQSLGNFCAALVLLVAHPYSVGDFVEIRSGGIGTLKAKILETGLTYVTVETDEGILKIPNSVMLSAGIGKPNDSSSLN